VCLVSVVWCGVHDGAVSGVNIDILGSLQMLVGVGHVSHEKQAFLSAK
jgi:hypothetical protein